MSRINYDLTKIKALVLDVDGVVSPSTVMISEKGEPIRMGNVKDGYALQLAVKQGLKIAVITGGGSDSVTNRFKILGINDVYQRVADKLPCLHEWMKKNNLGKEEVIYMGDDIPDLPCMRAVGLPACPRDAAWEIKETALYISPFDGGYGAVRDVVEQVLKAQDKWLSSSESGHKMFIW